MADTLSAPEDLYERDFYAWTQAQARALKSRRGSANALDYEHLAEEVGDLGKSERNAVRSSLRNIIVHLMLIQASRSEDVRRHWAVEILNFRDEAETHLTPSIRRLARNELEALHKKAAVYAMNKLTLQEPAAKVDSLQRWTLAELLGEKNDPIQGLIARRD